MSILGRYITRVFIGQLFLILISAVALLQLFDVMSQADDLLADLGGGVAVILRYSLLRLPTLVTFLLPFSVLIAALLTFGRLHRASELVALQALGMPFPRILLLLLPSLLVLATTHFLINDQLSPSAIRALAAWEKEVKEQRPNDIALWIRDGDNIVSIGQIGDKGRRLENLVIFHRDDSGNLTKQAVAGGAVYDGQGWWLEEIESLEVRPAAKRSLGITVLEPWTTSLRPDVVDDLAMAPSTLSLAAISRLLRLPDISSRPSHVYQTWWHKSFAVPLASIFMVVLATASVRGLQRQGGAVLNALIGFAGAFLYFVADGVLTAFGEAGSIYPAIAAWLPLLILALTAGAVLAWVTMPRGRRKATSLPIMRRPVGATRVQPSGSSR